MSNKQRVFVEVFHRGELSLGPDNRKKYGPAIYHWAVLVAPKGFSMTSKNLSSFDVTNGANVKDWNNLNPQGDWWFRPKYNVNPFHSGHFLGAVMIGKVPEGTTVKQAEGILQQVQMPTKNQTPEQNCVTWIRLAMKALQEAGMAENGDPEKYIKTALKLGDQILSDKKPWDFKKKFVNGTNRPM